MSSHGRVLSVFRTLSAAAQYRYVCECVLDIRFRVRFHVRDIILIYGPKLRAQSKRHLNA